MRRTALLLSLGVNPLVVLGLSKIHAKWVAEPAYDFTGSFRLPWAIAYILLLCVTSYAAGLPDQPRTAVRAAVTAGLAGMAAAFGIAIVQTVTGDALLPRFVVFGAVALAMPCQVAVNALARSGRTRDEDRDRVLLIGSGEEHDRLMADLSLEPERPAALVGALGANEAGSPGANPLTEAATKCRATVIVIDREAQAHDHVVAQAAKLHESGVRVRTLHAFYEEWLGKLPVTELERASLFFDIGEVHRGRYNRTKRLLDLACCLPGLILLAVLTPLVVIGNLIANHGPLMYRQDRVGKGGRVFTILKFRTMSPSEDDSGGAWTATHDVRVTPFGRFLRASHLDELPQVVNIVRGELAVVGPRPEQPAYVEELSAKLAFYDLRHLVRPGLTGWAQVKYGYAGDERDALEKLQYEFFYLRHQDLRFDLRVIGRTFRSIVGGTGRGR